MEDQLTTGDVIWICIGVVAAIFIGIPLLLNLGFRLWWFFTDGWDSIGNSRRSKRWKEALKDEKDPVGWMD